MIPPSAAITDLRRVLAERRVIAPVEDDVQDRVRGDQDELSASISASTSATV
jgi:hypothetical protein